MQKKELDKLLEGFIGGVIMDVTNAEQAKIAEDAGAIAVMALERVPADIRAEGGVARAASVKKIEEIMAAVEIPVMAKARIGHYEEARLLEAIGIDFIDESEVLTPADEYHIYKLKFEAPFVCGARNLGEALRRIYEGAAMIRTKGEAGTGDVNQAVAHMRVMRKEIAELAGLYRLGEFYKHKGIEDMELTFMEKAREYGVPKELVYLVGKHCKLPVPNFAAGGVATPADAVRMMSLGSDGVFVGSGIFKSHDPENRAKAIVEAVKGWSSAVILADASRELGEGMPGIAITELSEDKKTQYRGK